MGTVIVPILGGTGGGGTLPITPATTRGDKISRVPSTGTGGMRESLVRTVSQVVLATSARSTVLAAVIGVRRRRAAFRTCRGQMLSYSRGGKGYVLGVQENKEVLRAGLKVLAFGVEGGGAVAVRPTALRPFGTGGRPPIGYVPAAAFTRKEGVIREEGSHTPRVSLPPGRT